VSVDIGTVGVWLLITCAVVIAGECVLAAVWSLRLARKSATLRMQIESERAQIQSGVERLRAALVETRELWRPYARLLRWVRHPLVIALVQSYTRRWAPGR
jgi:hypothetical protein